MNKIFGLLTLLLLLNGCAESVALLGTAGGSASKGKNAPIFIKYSNQLRSKKQTGKSPLEHVLHTQKKKILIKKGTMLILYSKNQFRNLCNCKKTIKFNEN